MNNLLSSNGCFGGLAKTLMVTLSLGRAGASNMKAGAGGDSPEGEDNQCCGVSRDDLAPEAMAKWLKAVRIWESRAAVELMEGSEGWGNRPGPAARKRSL
jgi:hypothetical protein